MKSKMIWDNRGKAVNPENTVAVIKSILERYEFPYQYSYVKERFSAPNVSFVRRFEHGF